MKDTFNQTCKEKSFKSRSRPLYYWIVQIVIIAVLAWYISSKVSIETLRNELVSLDIFYFAPGLLILLIMNLFRPWRSWVLLKKMQIPVRWWCFFRWHQEACFLSYFTPAKTGELYRAFRVSSTYKSTGKAFAVSILDRLVDTAIVLILAMSSLAVQPHDNMVDLRKLAIALLLLIFATTIVLLNGRFRRHIKSLLLMVPENPFREKLLSFSRSLSDAFKEVSFSSFFNFLAVSVGIWAVYLFGFFTLFHSLTLNLSPISVISCVAITLFIQAAPITFCGFGTREAALILYLGNYGFDSSRAMSVSFLFVAVTVINMLVVSGFWFFCCKSTV